MVGTIIAGLIVAGVVALAVRYCYRNVKAGKDFGGCGGDCSQCHGCHHDVKQSVRK